VFDGLCSRSFLIKRSNIELLGDNSVDVSMKDIHIFESNKYTMDISSSYRPVLMVIKEIVDFKEEDIKGYHKHQVMSIMLNNEEDFRWFKEWLQTNEKKIDGIKKHNPRVQELKEKMFGRNRRVYNKDLDDSQSNDYSIKDVRMGDYYKTDKIISAQFERRNQFLDYIPRFAEPRVQDKQLDLKLMTMVDYNLSNVLVYIKQNNNEAKEEDTTKVPFNKELIILSKLLKENNKFDSVNTLINTMNKSV